MGAVRYDVVGDLILAPNDEASTFEVPLPFTFLGYNRVFVNNNGSIGFDWGAGDYTAHALSGEIDSQTGNVAYASIGPSIVAYWADVDTRQDPLGIAYVKYGLVTVGGRLAFICTWHDVGYYSVMYDKRASFQIILYKGDSFEMNYDKVEWTAGSASFIDYNYPDFGADKWGSPKTGFYLPTTAIIEQPGAIGPEPGYTLPSDIQRMLGKGDQRGCGGRYSPADPTHAYEFPGSGTGGETSDGTYNNFPIMTPSDMTDGGSNALIHSSRHSSVLGRYIFGGGKPPMRQRHRTDGLTTDTRQERGNGDSLQSSLRRSSRTYY